MSSYSFPHILCQKRKQAKQEPNLGQLAHKIWMELQIFVLIHEIVCIEHCLQQAR